MYVPKMRKDFITHFTRFRLIFHSDVRVREKARASDRDRQKVGDPRKSERNKLIERTNERTK